MLCHKCPYSAEIERLRGICSACVANDHEVDQPHGLGGKRVMVHLDAMKNADGVVETLEKRVDKVPRGGEALTPLPREVEGRLLAELAAFMRLDFVNQILLVWILRGESLSEFARLGLPRGVSEGKDGMSKQAIRKRVEVIRGEMPSVEKVILQMVRLNGVNRGKAAEKVPREDGELGL
jgi:hypothetical protein